VDPEKKYPFLASLLSPFRKRNRKTLGLVIAAIAVTGQARSFAIATTLARWLGTRLDSAVNRFYRLLRNHRVDYVDWMATWAKQLARGHDHLLIAVDWTEWHHELRMLVAAVVVGKRGIPLFAQAFERLVRRRSQNARENTFLRLLADGLRRAELTATLLCDRGFRRATWLLLLQQLRLRFVVRLMADVHVEITPGQRVALDDILLTPGRLIDLGWVRLRSDGVVAVRVIGYWAPDAREPWWLATSESGSARHILKLYDRRMTVEECFRDTKGQRFGVKLFWTHFRDPDALSRFVMLLAVALVIWSITGYVAAAYDKSLRLVCRTKGPRQSYVTIGLRIVTIERHLPELTSRWLSAFLDAPTLRTVGRFCVGGK
jgi:Transposase DDE domain